MAGTLSATITATEIRPSAVDLACSGALDVQQLYPRLALPAAYSGAGSLAATPVARYLCGAPLVGAGALSGTSSQKYAPAPALAGAGVLSATGVGIFPAFYYHHFNQADGNLSSANWTDRGPSPFPVLGNSIYVDTAKTCNVSYASVMSTDDVGVRINISDYFATSTLVFRLFLRSNNSHQVYAEIDAVNSVCQIGTAVGTYAAATRTTRATGSGSAGAGWEFRAVGNVYTLYRGSTAVASWTDTGNATYGQVNSTHREVGIGATISGSGGYIQMDDFAAWDIAAGNPPFRPSRMVRTSSSQNWATSSTWTTVLYFTAVGDGTYTSFGNGASGMQCLASKTGASFDALIPFNGGSLNRTHTIRIYDSTAAAVIATGAGVAANSGNCTVSGVADMVAGHSYGLQMNASGGSSGSTVGGSGWFQIT